MSSIIQSTRLIKGKAVTFSLHGLDKITVDAFMSNFDLDIEDGEDVTFSSKYNAKYNEDGFVITKAEVQEEMKNLAAILENPNFAEELIDTVAKKANGTFRKGAILHPYSFPWGQLWEDSYCYAHPAVKVKAITDTDLQIFFDHEKDTW